jgi:hypothetical protein
MMNMFLHRCAASRSGFCRNHAGWLTFILCIGLLASSFAAATTPSPGLRYYYDAPEAPVVDVDVDVVVYGGTSGGVAAAVQAARMGKSAVLIVFGRHIGGLTSGGLSATDGVSVDVQGGIAREFYDTVGNSGFRPSVAEQAFSDLLADPVPSASWDAPVPVYYEQRLSSVEKTDSRIVALRMENGSVFRGRMFIDCTYEGDLMAMAGVSYTVGRESQNLYGEDLNGIQTPGTGGHNFPTSIDPYVIPGDPESGLLPRINTDPGIPGDGDSRIQAYCFRMFLTQTNPLSFPYPQNYNPLQYEVLARLFESGADPLIRFSKDTNNHHLFNGAYFIDYVGGADGWPEGDYATREQIFQAHVTYQKGVMWFLQNDSRIPSQYHDVFQTWGLPQDEYLETGGWTHELYIREGRRMISDYVMTQQNCSYDKVAEDPIGLASYSMDSHHCQMTVVDGAVRNEGNAQRSPAGAYGIAYRAITPKESECSNLLVPWSLSSSHIAFGSIRMEPTFMVLSQSAATAAALSIDRGEPVQQLPYQVLRPALIADGQLLGSAAEESPIITVDNAYPANVTVVGEWSSSSSLSGYWGTDYLHDGNPSIKGGHSVTFTPNLPEAGEWLVQMLWVANPNRSTRTPVDIISSGSTNTVTVNQRLNGKIWNDLGTFSFDSGTQSCVTVRNAGADGYVIADAIRFVQGSATNFLETIAVLAVDPRSEEQGVPGRIAFMRTSGSSTRETTVSFEVGGTAVPGIDYVSLPSSVTLAGGQSATNLYIAPLDSEAALGPRTVSVTLLPDANYSVGSLSNAVITLYDTPYDHWRNQEFGGAVADSAGNDDPDQDGWENRFEFLMGLNPLSADLSPVDILPSIRVEDSRVVYEFMQRGAARSLTPFPEVTANLLEGEWSPLSESPQTGWYDPDTGDKLRQYELPASASTNAFLRLVLP